MRPNKTLKTMSALGFKGMAAEFERLSDEGKISRNERQLIGQLMSIEQQERDDKRIDNAIKKADLIYPMAHLNGIDGSIERELDTERFHALRYSNWIESKAPVIFTGDAGMGKKYLACAILRHAIECGRKVMCYETRDLLEKIALKRHASYNAPAIMDRFIKQLKGYDILMLHGFGMKTIPIPQLEDLAWLFNLRRTHGAFVIVSPFPIAKWSCFLGDTAIARDIMATTVKLSQRFELSGNRMMSGTLEEFRND